MNKNAARFANSKIIEAEKNTGISGNLNRGVKATSAEWFKLTAGDDLLLDNCIEDNMNFILNNDKDVNIVCSIKISFKLKPNGEKHVYERQRKKNIFFHQDITAGDQYQLSLRHLGPTPSTWFIRKEAFEKIDGCDESFPMVEDTPLKLKFLKSGYKFYRFDKETVFYRIHDESVRSIFNVNKIYKDWYLTSQVPMKKKYVYSNLSTLEKIIFDYQYFLAISFVRLQINNRNYITLILNKIMTFPSDLLYKWKRNRIKINIKNKYA